MRDWLQRVFSPEASAVAEANVTVVPLTDESEKKLVESRLLGLEARLEILEEQVRVIGRTTERDA